MMPAQLCDKSPEITVPLEPYTEDFDGILAQILRPNVYGYSLDAPGIAYIGGDPMLIQNPHDPACDECGKPMRFLFICFPSSVTNHARRDFRYHGLENFIANPPARTHLKATGGLKGSLLSASRAGPPRGTFHFRRDRFSVPLFCATAGFRSFAIDVSPCYV